MLTQVSEEEVDESDLETSFLGSISTNVNAFKYSQQRQHLVNVFNSDKIMTMKVSGCFILVAEYLSILKKFNVTLQKNPQTVCHGK